MCKFFSRFTAIFLVLIMVLSMFSGFTSAENEDDFVEETEIVASDGVELVDSSEDETNLVDVPSEEIESTDSLVDETVPEDVSSEETVPEESEAIEPTDGSEVSEEPTSEVTGETSSEEELIPIESEGPIEKLPVEGGEEHTGRTIIVRYPDVPDVSQYNIEDEVIYIDENGKACGFKFEKPTIFSSNVSIANSIRPMALGDEGTFTHDGMNCAGYDPWLQIPSYYCRLCQTTHDYHETHMYYLKTIAGNYAYCLDPSVDSEAEWYSVKNDAWLRLTDEMKNALVLTLYYGFPNRTFTDVYSDVAVIEGYAATQTLLWELMSGKRDPATFAVTSGESFINSLDVVANNSLNANMDYNRTRTIYNTLLANVKANPDRIKASSTNYPYVMHGNRTDNQYAIIFNPLSAIKEGGTVTVEKTASAGGVKGYAFKMWGKNNTWGTGANQGVDKDNPAIAWGYSVDDGKVTQTSELWEKTYLGSDNNAYTFDGAKDGSYSIREVLSQNKDKAGNYIPDYIKITCSGGAKVNGSTSVTLTPIELDGLGSYGYDYGSGNFEVTGLTAGGSMKIEIHNVAAVVYPDLKIIKQSTDGKVSGITFTFEEYNGIRYQSLDVTGVTGADGTLMLYGKDKNLKVGTKYRVHEVVPPYYKCTNNDQEITLVAGTNTLTFNNVPIGDLKIVKKATDGKISGISFLFEKKNGNVYSRVGTYTTNTAGEITSLTGLTIGDVYRVTEQYDDRMYEVDNNPQIVTIKQGVNTLTFTNTPKLGVLTASKTSDATLPVNNFDFQFTNVSKSKNWYGRSELNGQILQRAARGSSVLVNGDDGKATTFEDLEDGTYTFSELLSLRSDGDLYYPSSWKITVRDYKGSTVLTKSWTDKDLTKSAAGDWTTPQVAITGLTYGGTLEMEIHNAPTARKFSIQKVSTAPTNCQTQLKGNKLYDLSKVRFNVYAYENSRWTLKETISLNSSLEGKSSFAYNVGSEVRLVETNVPDGYIKHNYTYSTTPWKLTITADESKNVIRVENEPLYDPEQLQLQKYSKELEKPIPEGDASLQGAVFKWEYWDQIATSTTSTIWNTTPTRTWYFDTDASGKVKYDKNYLNPLFKSDELYDFDGSGTIWDLPVGSLRITEIIAPKGYDLIEGIFYAKMTNVSNTFVLDWLVNPYAPGTTEVPTYLSDDMYKIYEPRGAMGGFTLQKHDIAHENDLKNYGEMDFNGVKFDVINLSHNPVKIEGFAEAELGEVCYSFVLDEDGYHETGDIFPLGTYRIVESSGNDYYKLNSGWHQDFTISQSGTNAFDFDITDEYYEGQITIKKTNVNGTALMNAVLLLEWSDGTDKDGDGKEDWKPVFPRDAGDQHRSVGGCTSFGLSASGTLTTNRGGQAKFTGLYTGVKYRLTEVKSPNGYMLLKDPVYIDYLQPDEDFTVEVKIVNTKEFTLPVTGMDGMGIISWGIALAVAASGVTLLTVKCKKKKSK